jgi:hypothetical protein
MILNDSHKKKNRNPYLVKKHIAFIIYWSLLYYY